MDPVNETWSDRFCVYEVITPRIETMKVILVDNLIGDESHLSEIAARQPDFHAGKWVRLERMIASMAMANIANNVKMLVQEPDVRLVHLSNLNSQVVDEFDPDAILLSGTYRDFDLYAPALIENFNNFIRSCKIPVLAICGGHQLVGQAYGARVLTLDNKLPADKREGRLMEYQYRFVKIIDITDPIFAGVGDRPMARWQRYTKRRHLLRVWQNHGLQLDRLPREFKHLARGYLSEIQMMVLRSDDQLIYSAQFHIEKSFQDWEADKYWEHRNESRDGRLIFDNFLVEALKYRNREWKMLGDGGPRPVTGKVAVPTGSGSSNIPATGY